jgi:uncharacterized protein (TIGR02646 family)
MKYIQKTRPEPAVLVNFRTWVNTNAVHLAPLSGTEQWKRLNAQRKNELQDALIEEQGYICAYCNRRIHKGAPEDDEQLRIDHLEPKKTYKDKVFDYYNLVGCCHGDQKETDREIPPRSIHCDVSKGDISIPAKLFPTSPTCEDVVLYSSEGELTSTYPDVNEALKATLNMNCEKLASPRKGALTPYVNIELEPDDVSKLITHYKTPDPTGKLEPFCGAIIGYLRQNYAHK